MTVETLNPAPGATPVTGAAAVPVGLRRRVMSPDEAAAADRHLAGATPAEIVAWAVDAFGPRLVVTSSFADTTLLAIATTVAPDIEIVFLDTGFHFAETLGVMRRAMARYKLNLTVLRPDADATDVWASGSDACCDARKVAPLDNYLLGRADAWMSGLRRADSPERAETPIVALDRRGLVKVNPIAAMTDDEHAAFIADNDVMVNPLHAEGYASIGCWPCTEPSTDGRAGRWGATKTECGLHL